MRTGGLVLVVLLVVLGCAQRTVSEEQEPVQPVQANTAPEKIDSVALTLDEIEEREWVTFLIRHLYSRHPAQVDWLNGHSGPYELALLLEIAQHDQKVIILSAEEILKEVEPGWDKTELYDICRLIQKLKINVPHYETPGSGSRMSPMSIENGLVIFESKWPPDRTGLWLVPFGIPPTGRTAERTYDMDGEKFGERDLDQFKSQMLNDGQREKLREAFKSGETPVVEY